MKLSVIAVTYNSAGRIEACLGSIFGQLESDGEVIVVDNASCDRSADIVENGFPGAILIRNAENAGYGAALNQGIKTAKGSWILALNGDVALDENFIRDMRRTIKKLPKENIGMISPKIMDEKGRIDSTGLRLSPFRRFYNKKTEKGRPGWASYIFGPNGACAIYKKEMLEDIKIKDEYFDEDFFIIAEDFDIAWRANLLGWGAYHAPALRCRHKGGISKSGSALAAYYSFRNRFLLIIKNESIKNAPVLLLSALCYDLPRLVYLLFANRFTLRALREIKRLFPIMIRKRKIIRERMRLKYSAKKRMIIFNGGPFLYGAERGLLNLVKAVNERFAITVVLPKRGALEKKLKALPFDVTVKIFPLPVMMQSLSPFYYINFVLFFLINIIYFVPYVFFKNIDIVCTNSLILPVSGIIAKIARKKHIWCVREFFRSQPLNLFLGKIVNNFSDAVIYQSETIKAKICGSSVVNDGAGPRTSARVKTVIYEPVDARDYKRYDPAAARKELGLPLDSTIVTIISRIHPLKGQYEFIKDFKETLKRQKGLFLVIAGDISPRTMKNRLYRYKAERLIRKEGLNNVLILGFREDIGAVFSASDICVFPFRREEPYGIAVQEALAFGKKTFFPRTGGLKEIYDIFERGEELDTVRIAEAAGGIKAAGGEGFFIPDLLRFSVYKERIVSVLESAQDETG